MFDHFDLLAPVYERLIPPPDPHELGALLGLSPEHALLDAAGGTGRVSGALAASAGRVVVCDASPRMLEQARKKGLETVQAELEALPFADASFAGIVCGFGIRNVADLPAALREARRVLVPGGRLVVLEFFRPARLVTWAFHTVYASGVLPAVGLVVAGDADAYRYLARSMEGFLTRLEFEDALRDAGFVRVLGVDQLLGIAAVVQGEAP